MRLGFYGELPPSMMPGSGTEMYLMVGALHLGVGVVTAMPITRLVSVMIFAEAIYQNWASRPNRHHAR